MAKNTILKLCSRDFSYLRGKRTTMRIDPSDLGIGFPFIKGQSLPVRNCWHFSTDGAYAEVLFRDRTDFVDAMNRIYILAIEFNLAILAFCLMDNHIHFILYGSLESCRKFMHEYVRQTSSALARRHGYKNELQTLPIHHQEIADDLYLKTAICYVIKNPTTAGLPYMPYDYPWSSGGLYFRSGLVRRGAPVGTLPVRERIRIFHTKKDLPETLLVDGDLILPENYVEVGLVEKLYWSHRAFNYFLGMSREEDIESRGGAISRLSLPDAELREHRSRISLELFGKAGIRELSTTQRLRLAKELRRRFNSSPKQIARLVGLKFEQVESLL